MLQREQEDRNGISLCRGQAVPGRLSDALASNGRDGAQDPLPPFVLPPGSNQEGPPHPSPRLQTSVSIFSLHSERDASVGWEAAQAQAKPGGCEKWEDVGS